MICYTLKSAGRAAALAFDIHMRYTPGFILDLLWGKEEPLDYVSTTAPRNPPPS